MPTITGKRPPNKGPAPSDRKASGLAGMREVRAFQDHLQADKKSPYTVKEYGIRVKLLLEWIKKEPSSITPADLEEYKRHLSIDERCAKTTLYLSIKAIQAFFRFLSLNVSEDISPPKRGQPIPKYLTEREMGELILAASGDARDEAVILMLGYTGLRVGELCSLDVQDVDFSDGVITVRSGKGDKGRIALMEERTSAAIRSYLNKKKIASGPLFLSRRAVRLRPRAVQKMIRRRALQAGMKKTVTPHVLRHTFATSLLKRGADIRIIQQLLGHASVATTQIYTHVDDRALKEAYRRAKPDY